MNIFCSQVLCVLQPDNMIKMTIVWKECVLKLCVLQPDNMIKITNVWKELTTSEVSLIFILLIKDHLDSKNGSKYL
jgi:hypothetical protein